MFETIKGVIFDLDGTLVDSMWVWSKIDTELIQTLNLGITPQELMKDVAHYSFNETARYFKDTYGLRESVEEIQDIWIRAAENQYARNVPLKAGAREFLQQLKDQGVKLAIATSNTRHLLSVCLQANDIHHFFDALVTTDDTAAKSKSQPDVYLLAAESIGISPSDIVVFEDVPHAMKGARLAGMRVVAVDDIHTNLTTEEAGQLADLFIKDFTSLLKEPLRPIQ